MIVSLLWLTVSAPFVFSARQELAKQDKSGVATTPFSDNEEESPFGSSTEEKAPTANSFSEEYIHDHHADHYFLSLARQYHNCGNAGTYIAYHGELLVPPPDMI